MAVVNPVITAYDKKGWGPAQAFLVSWEGVTESDTCARYIAPVMNDGIISVDGTFGGTSVALHGSNDPADANFIVLKDIEDTVIGISAAGHSQVAQHPLQYKPVLTGGSGTTINIRLLLYGKG